MESIAGSRRPKHLPRITAHPVRNDDLLEKTQGEQAQTDGQIAPAKMIGPRFGKLRHHFRMVDNRARNQVRKEGDEQQEITQVILADDAPADIHEISDLREGEKGYSQGKHVSGPGPSASRTPH